MVGLPSLQVYNTIFNTTEENNKFELHTDLFDEFSLTELKDELEKILVFSYISPEYLQDKIVGHRVIKTYKILESEQRRTDGYYM